MSAILSPTPKLQFFDANGAPLSGGKLYTYAAGTTTPQVTYTDSTGATPNANPVIADSRGEMSVWMSSILYKFVLKTATDTTIWTVDNISVNASSAQSTPVIATQGQTAVTVPTYGVGGFLMVMRNGVVQNYNVDYTETNSTTITFVAPGLSVGDVIITRF
tara:strand:+ start:1250 stop:1732 length:483 start_codon:yes stop_codon:yes gene_type:complete